MVLYPIPFDKTEDFTVSVSYTHLDPVSHILKKEKEGKKRIGCVAVCTGAVSYTHLDVYKRQKWMYDT